jgi:hypothetical protein
MKSMTNKQGKKYNNPASIKDIEPFIEFHQLRRDEVRHQPLFSVSFSFSFSLLFLC